MLIGALVGSAGGLIIDQILKHRERRKEKAYLANVEYESCDCAPQPLIN